MRTRVDDTWWESDLIDKIPALRGFEKVAHSIVVPLDPSTNFPPIKRPVLKEVLPLCAGVFHS